MFDIFDEEGYSSENARESSQAGDSGASSSGSTYGRSNDYSYYDSSSGSAGNGSSYSYGSSGSSSYGSGSSGSGGYGGSSSGGGSGRSFHEPKRKSSFGSLIAKAACLGLVFGLVASGVMFGFNKAVGGFTGNDTPAVTAESGQSAASNVSIVKTSQTGVSTTDAQDVSGIVEEVMPSIVAVNTTVESTMTDWFGRQYRQQGEGAGSGIIISSTEDCLYILTNYHVIEDSTTVSVQFSDDSNADASVRGSDQDADIAVLEVKTSDLSAETKAAIKVAVMGDSDALKAGASAIAIGNALGYGQSVTTGVISATSREVQLTDKTMTLVQTSAAINPGNSGGALLNGKGEVIGVNTVKFSDTDVEGMGYAIPINSAIKTATGIIDGTITTKTDDNTPYLGIAGGTIDKDAAERYEIPQGVYVSNVVSGSAADRAGLEAGCVITRFNGKETLTMETLQEAIAACAPGDSVKITAQFADADGKYTERELSTILGARSESEAASSDDSGSSGFGGSYGQEEEDDFFGNGGYNWFGGFGR